MEFFQYIRWLSDLKHSDIRSVMDIDLYPSVSIAMPQGFHTDLLDHEHGTREKYEPLIYLFHDHFLFRRGESR